MALEATFYGYVAAAVGCVAFGSFAVPIKSEAARSIDVDPLGKCCPVSKLENAQVVLFLLARTVF